MTNKVLLRRLVKCLAKICYGFKCLAKIQVQYCTVLYAGCGCDVRRATSSHRSVPSQTHSQTPFASPSGHPPSIDILPRPEASPDPPYLGRAASAVIYLIAGICKGCYLLGDRESVHCLQYLVFRLTASASTTRIVRRSHTLAKNLLVCILPPFARPLATIRISQSPFFLV